ncbi:MAG: hypothetical protein JWM24_1763, partial [Solirubrobacterales bacterium]|nr:hypothetical protein [Solirubrobacterales bacterium]
LVPMLLTYKSDLEEGPGSTEEGVRERRRSPRPQDPLLGRPALLFAGAFLLVSALVMLWPAIDPGLHTVYDRTIAYQSTRDSPFSIWGQVPSLEPLRIVILAATAALSLFLAFRPKRKSLVQVAALGAALLIALQLTMQHWFYLYIVWFYPLLLIAMSSLESSPDTPPNVLRFSPESHRGQPQTTQRASE